MQWGRHPPRQTPPWADPRGRHPSPHPRQTPSATTPIGYYRIRSTSGTHLTGMPSCSFVHFEFFDLTISFHQTDENSFFEKKVVFLLFFHVDLALFSCLRPLPVYSCIVSYASFDTWPPVTCTRLEILHDTH